MAKHRKDPPGARRDARVDDEDTPPAKIEGARFPTAPFEQHEEHRALEPFKNEGQTVFDPEFPGKQRPPVQQLIDREFLYHKTNDLRAFVAALKGILPFWVKHHHWYRDAATRMTFNIHQRSETLRQEYNREHNADIRPMPNNLFEMESWRFDTERAIEGAGKDKRAIKKVDVKDRFTFHPGQTRFDGKDMGLPSDAPVTILKKLVDNFGAVVPYEVFDPHYSSATPGTLPKSITRIRQAFRDYRVPCEIKAKTGRGYLMREIPSPPKGKKRVRKKS